MWLREEFSKQEEIEEEEEFMRLFRQRYDFNEEELKKMEGRFFRQKENGQFLGEENVGGGEGKVNTNATISSKISK